MIEHQAPYLSLSAGLTRAFVAALLVLAGLVAPVAGNVPARAAPSGPVTSGAGDDDLKSQLRADLEAYLQARGAAEHISAAGLSVNLRDHRSTIDVSAGTTTFGGSVPVRPDSVWQIGSNTKAFTSVLLLQLEAEHRLSIDDTLAKWLPQYPQWRDVTIRRLLNMTSGIATYDDQPAWYADYAADPHTYFSPERLVGYAQVTLRPGRSANVRVNIDPAAPTHPLSYFDQASHHWSIAPGVYRVYVGTSERDTPLTATVTVR